MKNSTANAEGIRDTGSIPGSGRSLEEGNGNLSQYSCLENSTDRASWWTLVHKVTKSWAQLKRLNTQRDQQCICINPDSQSTPAPPSLLVLLFCEK